MALINPNNLHASLPLQIRNSKGVKALNENDQLRISEFVDVESGVVYKEDNRTITRLGDEADQISAMQGLIEGRVNSRLSKR